MKQRINFKRGKSTNPKVHYLKRLKSKTKQNKKPEKLLAKLTKINK